MQGGRSNTSDRRITVGDPRDNDVHVEEIVRRLAAEFGPKHVQLQACITQLRKLVDDRFDEFDRRLSETERKINYLLLLEQADQDPSESLVPGPNTSRPLALDRACRADTPATILMAEFGANGLEIEPEPGTDPKKLWPTVITTIREAEGA
jgi:hypothetical protein